MGKHETDGFSPELKTLSASRPSVMVNELDDPSEARTQRVATWVSMSVAVFTPIFAIAVVFGWMPLRLSLEIILGVASFILVVGGALAAVNLRRSFLRANRPWS